MQIHSATFVSSSPDFDSCPDSKLPEFAFIGRSNVGKSSLINSLTNKKDLAVVSRTPGRTRLINFFLINNQWSLVDLPGYGYAKAPGQARHKFNEFVSAYLAQRKNLSCVFVLIDARHSPQQIDLNFTEWLIQNSIPFVLIFTKTDKIKASVLKHNTDHFKKAMLEFCEQSGLPRIYHSSSKTGGGRREILEFINLATAKR